jgi:hypothetical protein
MILLASLIRLQHKFSITLNKSIANKLDDAIIHTYSIHCFKQVVTTT